jgi:hypothetical protein
MTMSALLVPNSRARRRRGLAVVAALLGGVVPLALSGSAAPAAAAGPPDAPLYFSTAGSSTVPGVGGSADDSDIYLWNGTAFSRSTDVSTITNPVPGSANLDGLSRVDATHFYASFNGNVSLPGLGTVQDEDVVYYNAGTWSVFLDGTPASRGLSSTDVDAISVVGTTLYFSTDSTTVPAGVSGSGDDADIYSWNGSTFARVVDASTAGWSTANVDGLVWVDSSHVYLSYSDNTTVPTLGAVQDEDVVSFASGAWSVYFDGTAHNLTSNNLDIDAFSLPNPTTPQTITFASLPGMAFGDADFTVSATASSGLPVGFLASGSCSNAGTLIHLTGAGSCTITASQPGDGITYLPAPDVVRSFSIAPGNQTITFGSLADKTIYHPDFALDATASSGLTVGFAATGECTVTGAVVHLTGIAGSCTITASQAGDANWSAATDVVQSFTVEFVVPTAELYAVSGTTTLAGQSVTVLGYNTANAAVTAPGGPTITVTQGDDVVLVLHNQLTEPTSLVVRGVPSPSDLSGAPAGGTTAYVFTPTEPGTFIYEAGSMANGQHQVAMGLFGTLIVNPISGTPYGSTNQAVVLVSDIDPALNNAPNPAAFDMRSFAPKYTILNGAVYSGSANLVTATPGDELLLRYVNAGANYHSMSVLGASQRIVGDDGHALAQPYTVVAQTVGPGQTFDAIVGIPSSAAPGTKLAVFDASLKLRNRNRRPATATATTTYGGALGFITIDGVASPTDTVGPVSSNLVATTTSFTATVSDATTGGSDVVAAEYFLDSPGAPGTGTPMAGSFGSVTVSASVTYPTLSPGAHVLSVRGRDSAGNWGPLVSKGVSTDSQGPTTTGLALNPNPANGSVDVALHATGSDVGAGGSNVTAAEYTIDGGAPSPMAVNLAAPTVSLDATIPAAVVAGLSGGSHSVAVRAQDAAGNWGSPSTIALTVDTTGPTTDSATAAPDPNNGTVGVNSSTPAVRVTASITDTTSVLTRAEGFIDTVGANGTGFLFVPVDGVFDEMGETVSVDIPLSTIAGLAAGVHSIHVHGRDAAGNWGPALAATLTIDKTPPSVTGITRSDPSPTTATSVSFTVAFSEAVTGVTASNFTVVQGAGLTGASVTGITGSGASRTVTVSTGSGGGTLGLNLTAATGIKDVAGNALPSAGLPIVGQVYTVTTPPLYFSTSGNTNPPGVGGSADDADVYYWSGTAFNRSIDVTAITNPLPGGANVDGFDRVDATHFYMSFNGNVSVPGVGTVQNEDVVHYNAGTWSMYFDGSAHGLGGTDLDAISVVGSMLYFSTNDTDVPPGVTGFGDDADIYSWNGASYTRAFDASALGWSTANVDGVVVVDSTHVYLSYSSDTTISGFGSVNDEDVVYRNGSTWSTYFDGTGKGLTSGNLDVDAFDIP